MQRISANAYQSRDDLLVDLEQIVKNSEQFNGNEHSMTEAARRMLERAQFLLFEGADPQIERLEHSIAGRHGLASPTLARGDDRDRSFGLSLPVDSPAPSSAAPLSAADGDADAPEGDDADADADAEVEADVDLDAQLDEDEDTGAEWSASRASASGAFSGASIEQSSTVFDYMNGARARTCKRVHTYYSCTLRVYGYSIVHYNN